MKVLFLITAVSATALAAPARPPVTVSVDATDAPRRILHAKLAIPASPGPLALHYPKWIPGEHAPTGPIGNLAGLQVSAAGKPLAWRRDPVDLYTFTVDVPAGARAVDVALDYLVPVEAVGHGSGGMATDHLAIVNWHLALLYPDGARPDELTYAATLKLPPGWSWGSALAPARAAGATVEFKPVPLTSLIDSPVLIGDHLRHVALDATHEIVAASDSDAATRVDDALLGQLRGLVAEAQALFGARHYRSYHFLVALSDYIAHGGIEHHESSDNRGPERTFTDDNMRLAMAGLLPHEFTHSWNGKYRRPAGLATPDYQQPMKDDLLWVYEGLTTYWGTVLTARSGLLTVEQARDGLAWAVADLEATRGRAWRPLADTAVAAPSLYGSGAEWRHWRRSTDFYLEGSLVWLEVDALLRKQTGGARSLDDFARRFYGGESGAPAVVPYQLDDVVKALEAIAPGDWRRVLAARLDGPTQHAPVDILEATGWRLAFDETPTQMFKAREERTHKIELTHSIGVIVDEKDGTIADVIPDSAAARAGVGPGMKLVAVNSRKWTPRLLREAVAASKTTPVELLLENGDYLRVHRLDYKGGARYPHLVRIPSVTDTLTAILTPLRAGAVRGHP